MTKHRFLRIFETLRYHGMRRPGLASKGRTGRTFKGRIFGLYISFQFEMLVKIVLEKPLYFI